jgi:hypothetical protein
MGLLDKLAASPLRGIYEALPERFKLSYRLFRLRDTLREYERSPHGLAQTRRLLEPLQGKYRGKRIVVMGNGPSLRKTDWSLLRKEFTIGLNRIYLLREEMGFDPSFFVCVNDLLIEQFIGEMANVPCLKVLDWTAAARHADRYPDLVCIPFLPTYRFHTDITRGWYMGGTVTFAAMQLAYYLGFSQVILIGVDHRFNTTGPPGQAVVSQGADTNHFHPDYFGKGVKWHLPNLEESETAYRLAKAAFESDGREILDCTLDGNLAVFPKRRLNQVL